MENYQAGDLADIVRATVSTVVDHHGTTAAAPDWQFQSNNPIGYYSVDDPTQNFSDPYTSSYMMRIHNTPSSGFFYNNSNIVKVGVDQESRITTGGWCASNINGHGDNNVIAQKSLLDEDRPASNMFSRMLHISPNSKLPADDPPLFGSNNSNNNSNNNNGCLISPISSSRNCLAESTGPAGLQISSPRNTGIKRRKSQAKKVVCVPAPAPANSSRASSGEVVPSDLWAWRKYGQKPIKGSPYPRGYYRCSSSKGCLARKQVERSRTDPNMLVITYTWEHNHPWPTQRNALAGSTRSSHPAASKNQLNTKNSPPQLEPTNSKRDDQQKENTSSTVAAHVKEEIIDDQDHFGNEFDDQGTSYKPTLADSEESCSFFKDLGEIEADLVFTQGFCSNINDHYHADEGIRENKELDDPFTFYDWATTATTSYGEGNMQRD